MSDLKLYRILETFDKLEEEDVDESQTKVQTMGNKVKVTTDGDTTEFDDAETAKAMMGNDDDDNQFATESADEHWTECPTCGKDILTSKIKKHRLDVHGDKVASDADMEKELNEGGLGGDMWDAAADELEFDNFDDASYAVQDAPPEEFGIPDDEWMISDLEEAEPSPDDLDPFGENPVDDEEDPFGEHSGIDDDGTEFATFNSEDENHRKRLQRGTPVVLSPELFTNPDGNRRGVFVNRSPSGHFGTVVRDIDGKEINVHLSDIKSADLVNNSIYEEYDINFEAMLADDITMTQTTNLENPENDTTTVTAVGPDAGDELASMMANAGLNSSAGYSDVEADDEMGIDTGEPAQPEAEPEAELGAPGMQDMIGIVDGPEVAEGGYGDFDDDPTDNSDLFPMGDPADIEPTDADLDAIEFDTELDFDMDESRDIEYTNTPGELEAGVDVMTHGLSGGLNRPKRMYKSGNRWGDNGMQDPMESVDEILETELDEMFQDELDETRPGSPATSDRNRSIANDPSEKDGAAPSIKRKSQRAGRYLRKSHGMGSEQSHAMPFDALDEELSPEMQRQKELDQEKIRVDRDMSRKSKGSRLTGRGRGTDRDDKSIRFGLGEGERDDKDGDDDDMAVKCPHCGTINDREDMRGHTSCENCGKDVFAESKFVNEHEDVDNFLNLYKAFSIRGEKK